MARRDAAALFQQLDPGLIPPDETIQCVVDALPRGVGHERSPSTPIGLEGEAASWPTHFARHPSKPGHWSEDIRWFFWVVITDKQLHVFEGHFPQRRGDPLIIGHESMHHPLDRVDRMEFKERLGISDLSLWFKDGSAVHLDVGRQKFDDLREVVKRYGEVSKPGSARSRTWRRRDLSFIGAFLLFLGSVTSVGAARGARDHQMLVERGVVTSATVTRAVIHSGGKTSNRYAELDVEYSDEFGIPSEGVINSCGSDPEDMNVGDEVEIVYDPEQVAPPEHTQCILRPNASGFVVGGLIGVGAGTVMVILGSSAAGWGRRRWAIPLVIIGVLFMATALQDDCYCNESLYTGASLLLIGLLKLIRPPLGAKPHPGSDG